MQIASSGMVWVSTRRLGVPGVVQALSGLVALGGFLMPWSAIEIVPVVSFNMSGWEVALHLGKGALWVAPLGALALVGTAMLRKMQGVSRFVLNLLAFLLGSASLVVIMLALNHGFPVPGANPAFVVGEGPGFGLYLTLLGLLIGALSGLIGLFKIRVGWNHQTDL